MNCIRLGYVVGFLFATMLVLSSTTIAQEAQEAFESQVADLETIATLEAIDVGIRRWRDALNLKCELRFRQGLAHSSEEAINGQFPDGCDEAICRFVKMGDAILYDFKIQGEPAVNKETKVSTYSSFLLATANNVEAYRGGYSPLSPLAFTNILPENQAGLMHRQLNLVTISPFVVMGANQGALFRPLIDSNLYTFSSRQEGEDLVVSCALRNTDLVTTYTVDTSRAYPMLKSIREVDGGGVTIASDFVKLNNGNFFPGRFVVTVGPVVPVGGSEQRWVSRIWDLERSTISEPTRENFIINVDPNVKLSGLGPHQRPVNILDITVDSLSNKSGRQTPIESLDNQFATRASEENTLASTNWNSRFIWFGIAAIVFGGFLLFAVKSFSRRHSCDSRV